MSMITTLPAEKGRNCFCRLFMGICLLLIWVGDWWAVASTYQFTDKCQLVCIPKQVWNHKMKLLLGWKKGVWKHFCFRKTVNSNVKKHDCFSLITLYTKCLVLFFFFSLFIFPSISLQSSFYTYNILILNRAYFLHFFINVQSAELRHS